MSKLVAIVSDIHFPHHNKAAWAAFKKWVRINKPYRIIIDGDVIDAESVSRFSKDIHSDPYLVNEIKLCVSELNWLHKYCKNIDMMEGNHCARLFLKLKDTLGYAAKGLKGLTLEEQLYAHGLNPDIKYYKESVKFKGIMVGGVLIRHGDRQAGGRFGHGKHVAAARLEKSMGQDEVIGHTHRLQMFTKTGIDKTAFAISNGCMSNDHPYNLTPDWQKSFVILEVYGSHDEYCTPYPVLIRKGKFSWAGTVYSGNE